MEIYQGSGGRAKAAAEARAFARAGEQTEPDAEMLADNTARASSSSVINIAVTTNIPSVEQVRDLEQGGSTVYTLNFSHWLIVQLTGSD